MHTLLRRLNSRLLTIAFALACAGAALEAHGAPAPGYHFSGVMVSRIEMSHLSPERREQLFQFAGRTRMERHWTWNVWVEDGKWRIDVGEASTDSGERYQVGCDGDTTYSVSLLMASQDERGLEPRRGSGAAPGKANDSIAVIEPGVIPYEGDLPVHPLWLALCAPRLLDHFPGNEMPSLSKIGGSECIEARSVKFKFQYELFNGSHFFELFELLNDGYIREKMEDGRFLVIPRDPPYDSGFVQARLTGEQVQELGEMKIPTQFSYARLVPSGSTDKSLGTIDRWTLTVDAVHPTNLTGFAWLPKPTGNTDVKDRRYAQASPSVFSIDYRLKGNAWLQKHDPFLTQRYDSFARSLPGAVKEARNPRRFVVRALFGLTVVAAGLLLFRNLFRSGRQRSGQ
jgi:hypothetical protein